eukprot:2882501-Prymnesium_polylepis.1
MVNSESTTQVMWMLMYLFKECPEYSDKLKALAYDAACIARKHVDAKMRETPRRTESNPRQTSLAFLGGPARHRAPPLPPAPLPPAPPAYPGPGVLPATSSAYPLYERIAQLKFFVDNMHFKNHNENDTFCVENCDPMLFPECTPAGEPNPMSAPLLVPLIPLSLARDLFCEPLRARDWQIRRERTPRRASRRSSGSGASR